MTHQQHLTANTTTPATTRRFCGQSTLVGAALLALIASACGTTATTSSNPIRVPAEPIPSVKIDSVDVVPQVTLPKYQPPAKPELTLPPTTTAPPKAPVVTTPPTTVPPTVSPTVPPRIAPPPTTPPTVPPTVPPKVTPTPTPDPLPTPIDDLVLVPVDTITPIITIPPIYPAPAANPCGVFAPIPAESQITSDLTVDLDGDGAVDDQIITYLDGVYTLRSVSDGVISEIEVPDVGVSSIRALGVGNVGELSVGNEVVVRTGGGASSARIAFFGHDADGCMFEFTRYGTPLEVYVGATIGNSSGASCGESYIAQWEYSLDVDDTYFGSSAAYFESTPGDFTYLPASDDFSEGLALDDLSPAHLDCFGFGV